MPVVQVFMGSDIVLLDKAVRDAAKAALGGQPADFALAELTDADYLRDDQESLAPLIDAAQTPPMLTDRRVVIGHHLARFSTADSVEPLVAYLNNPLDTTHLILVWDRGPTLSKRTAGLPKRLGEALTALGVEVTKTDVDSKASGAWVDRQLVELGLQVDGPGRRLLTEHLGENINRLVGIGRALLAAYGPGVKLGEAEVAPFLGEAGDVPPWDLTDAIARGDVGGSLRVYRRMVHGGERHPLAILGSLTGHYARMASLDGAPVRGEREAAEYLGIKGSTFPVKKALEQARKMGRGNVKRAWGLLAQADLDLRGATAVDGEQVLEVLVARLARL